MATSRLHRHRAPNLHHTLGRYLRTGKNYLGRVAFRKLEILYEQLFLFVENKIISGELMILAKWEDQLHKLLIANGYDVGRLYPPNGPFLPQRAVEKAERELQKFKARQRLASPRQP